ncbi:MAG: TauD/TfdA family dioxygenase [Gammaproteobacteria bacterium]|nr:MAG: TauD/TfdA family dioxygenase [Gammaproteobacteria bacterium]
MIQTTPPNGSSNYLSIESADGALLESLSEADIIPAFKRHGALLFRGFRFDLNGLSQFTSRFCSRFVRNESGRRSQVSADGTTQSVNLGTEPFPLHPELSRVPWRPDVAWFACASPPSADGETLVCDGVQIAESLAETTRSALLGRDVLYTEETPMGAFTEWLGIAPPDDAMLTRLSSESPFKFQRRDGRIFREFTRPFLHRPLFCERKAFGNFLLFARYMLGTQKFPTFEDGSIIPEKVAEEIREVSERLTVAHRWRTGDVLMLDNSRFLHGRNGVRDPAERQIWTQFGYAAFLEEDDPRLAEPWRYTDDALSIFFGPHARDLAGTARAV